MENNIQQIFTQNQLQTDLEFLGITEHYYNRLEKQIGYQSCNACIVHQRHAIKKVSRWRGEPPKASQNSLLSVVATFDDESNTSFKSSKPQSTSPRLNCATRYSLSQTRQPGSGNNMREGFSAGRYVQQPPCHSQGYFGEHKITVNYVSVRK